MTKVAPAPNSTSKYFKALSNAQQDGKRVIITRTREEFRLMQALRDFTFTNETHYQWWTTINGWAHLGENTAKGKTTDERKVDYDKVFDPVEALRVVHSDVPRGIKPAIEYKTPFTKPGLYVMNYPHFPLTKERFNSTMLALLKEYAFELPNTAKTLVMLIPENFVIPEELQDNVSVIDFSPPINEEYRETADHLMHDFLDNEFPGFRKEDIAVLNKDESAWNSILNNAAGMTESRFLEAFSFGLRSAIIERRATKNENAPLNVETIINAIAMEKTEVVKQSHVLEMMHPENIQNVGGLENLKQFVRKRRICFSEEAKKFGIDAPKGMLLVGPPGTGKSLCAKAVASEWNLPLIKFDISRVFDKYVGESEQKIRSALKLVESMKPCVLLVDEIDKIFSTGQSGDGGISTRVMGTFLTWMQESSGGVFTIMTANRVGALPSELVRKGRLDEIFSVSLPYDDEIIEIAKIHLNKRGHNPDDIKDLDVLKEAAKDYVPAEIEAAVKEALIEAFSNKEPLTGELIATQLKLMVPLSVAFADDFNAMDDWSEKNARPASVKKAKATIASVKTKSKRVISSDAL